MRDFLVQISYDEKSPIWQANGVFDNPEFSLFLDGSVLNEKELLNKYGVSNLELLIHKKFLNENYTFIDELIGEFNGWWYSKLNGDFLLFTNHHGSRKVFYSILNNTLLFSNRVQTLVSEIKKSNHNISLNSNAAFSLLKIGSLLEDDTLIQEIKKLSAGNYLFWNNKDKKIENFTYHDFKWIPQSEKTMNQLLDDFNERFEEAVRLEYAKDEQSQTKSWTFLSGGLDSRMNVITAHDLQIPIHRTICFSQSGYLDHTISQDISKDLDIPYQFIPIDSIDFIRPIDELTALNEFSVYYTGSSHVYHALKTLDFSKVNAIHSGQIGDGILGNFNRSKKIEKPDIKRLLKSYPKEKEFSKYVQKIANTYETEEDFLLYNLAFNRTVAGSYVVDEFAYLYSPFFHPSVMDFALSIPPKFKYNHHFYFEWMSKYHPIASQYPWETTGFKPRSAINKNRGAELGYRIKKYGQILKGKNPKQFAMLPYQYWYERNSEIQHYLQRYFKETIEVLDSWPELKKDAQSQFELGAFNDKILVLTLLSSIKTLFKT